MRIEHINAKTAAQARKLSPWAAKVVKVCGGYRAFESIADYMTWKAQQ